MRRDVHLNSVLRIALVGVMICASGGVASASSSIGHLTGLLLNEAGEPLSDVLVSLLRSSSRGQLPILSRTNERGRIQFTGLEAGTYQIRVSSPRYRSPEGRVVEILPGRTSVVTLILQQFLDVSESDGPNLSSKALLRTSGDRRLIFRHLPEPETGGRSLGSFFDEAVFQVYSNAGLGGDYMVFPGDPWGGTSTNFALVDALGGRSQYILAGQLNSGQDSLWRLKNFVDYQLSERHSVRLLMGYGRISFDQPSLALLNNPISLGDSREFTSAVGTTKLLTLGFEEQFRVNRALSLLWGLELDQVRSARSDLLLSPTAQITLLPTESTEVRFLMTAKRSTVGNTLTLPDGEKVTLADAVLFTRVGDQLSFGTSRHYQGSVTQRLDDRTEVELASFDNQLQGGTVPILALLESDSSNEVLQLDDDQARTKGYRVSVRRELGENLKAEVSYIQGSAVGLSSDRSLSASDLSALRHLFGRHRYHLVSTQMEAVFPSSGTRVTALVKMLADGSPIVTLDTLSDVYETSNQGVNVFIRQIVPLPASWLNFLGLDFLATYKVEALLDVRNVVNQDLGLVSTPSGDVVLVRNPRTVRGGISFKF